jgi:hypothetical protein
MHKSVIIAGAVGALAFTAVASADDRLEAAQECRFERGASAATREAFEAKYRNFGACVSARARDEAREHDAAQDGAAKTCREERSAGAEAFAEKYGTNANKRNAFGKCVSRAAKAAEEDADDADREAAADRKSAAKRCARERRAGAEAFAKKYGTNANRRNAFGKCVSARADDRD